jgi:hypothetical protein
MTDFYPLVLKALSKLPRDTEEDRQALYQRARTTLAERLRKIEPKLPEQRIMQERLAFEEAVRRAEADWARGHVEHELLAKLAEAIEHDTLAEGPQHPAQMGNGVPASLRQGPSGARFAYTGHGTFAFASTGSEADRVTAADPLARSIRSELEYKARELAGRMSRVSDRAQWAGLIDTVRLFAKRLGGSETEIAAEIGTLWALHVALGLYVDSDAAPSSDQVFVPPDADMLRALRDLVAASGPWIGMFPTGRALEDTMRQFGSPASETLEAAARCLRGAVEAALLRDDAASLLRAVLDAGAASHLGDRAGNWAIHTASNLGIALLLALAEIVGHYEKNADAAESPDIARRIERVLLEQEASLLLVSSDLPNGARHALRAAIDAIRAGAEDDV